MGFQFAVAAVIQKKRKNPFQRKSSIERIISPVAMREGREKERERERKREGERERKVRIDKRAGIIDLPAYPKAKRFFFFHSLKTKGSFW